MRRLIRGRNGVTAVACLAALLALSIVSPAVGGPSLSGVAKTAKKALKTANSAKKTANSAKKTAGQALREAAAGDTGAIMFVESPEVTVPANEAESAQANCPSGYKVISGGGSAITSDGIAVSITTSGRAGWGVVTYSSLIAGTVQAQALCAPTGKAVAASTVAASRAALERKLEAATERVRAGQR